MAWRAIMVALLSVVPSWAAEFIDAEARLAATLGPNWRDQPVSLRAELLRTWAERLPRGGAIHLPTTAPCGTLDFRAIADDVQITGGTDGEIVLGNQHGTQLLFSRLQQRYETGIARSPSPQRPVLLVAGPEFRGFDPKVAPMSGLLALCCEGGIRINADVTDCAWIAGANAFGNKTVTANARVDKSLFLWFGINWPFKDFNGHLDPKNAKKNWLDNAQMWFDCKGGGTGTRIYLMIETNYGNPGPGVVLMNCEKLALYHGSTERASSQGPGVYWLKDCKNVQLGLRRIFSASRNGNRAAIPAHDITIEGGSGNILHNVESYGNSQQATLVNSDPNLQVWSLSTDFETQGVEQPGILRFAYTPHLNQPAGDDLAKVNADLPKLLTDKRTQLKLEDTPENNAKLTAHFRSGRDAWHRLNATAEQTFVWHGADLTTQKPPQPVPAPPSLPATDAPRLRRPIEFTQQPDFGQELRAAGLDVTGQTPADDVLSKHMYGLTRAEVQKVLDICAALDAKYRAAKLMKDDPALKDLRAELETALQPLYTGGIVLSKPGKKGQSPKRPPLHIPAGTIKLAQPLVLVAGWNSVWGAGPDKTTFRPAGDFAALEHHSPGALANFSVVGGKVGIAITGSDHHDPFAPTLHSYVAGATYYNLHFRQQSFAGMHVGNNHPDIMGGAEHDQNRYIDLHFTDTGKYGIYMNQNMLDKWLLLHSKFSGQSMAGVAIKFNNLIHGGIIGCEFANINGPGLDLMGGNPEIRFRPHQVLIDQCTFTECGNATQPAVDAGAGVCTAVTHCTITTKTKPILTGLRSGAQICEDVTLDVQTGSNPAVQLRAIRNNLTGRPNGHLLRNVTSNGPVAWINDANAHNQHYEATGKLKGFDWQKLNWDANPALHELPPKNGWLHPYVLYQCQFGTQKFDYVLLNVDVDKNNVLKTVALR